MVCKMFNGWKSVLQTSKCPKIVIFGPFQSLHLQGEKVLTIKILLKKSIVLPSWGQDVKLSWKIPFRGVNSQCHFDLKLSFWPLSESTPERREKFKLPNLAWQVSWGKSVKIAWKIPCRGVKMICDFHIMFWHRLTGKLGCSTAP